MDIYSRAAQGEMRIYVNQRCHLNIYIRILLVQVKTRHKN
jgi:hypothetical protein